MACRWCNKEIETDLKHCKVCDNDYHANCFRSHWAAGEQLNNVEKFVGVASE